jgi:hypothetical protein
VLFVGAVFASYYLSEYIQVYGVTHFMYPMQGDVMTYGAIRDTVFPLASQALTVSS